MSILGISKEVMYDFHYNFIHKHFPDVLLGFTDTDSFMYSIPCQEDIYKKLMDFSNYNGKKEEGKHKCEKNRLIPGKFKDEGAGKYLKYKRKKKLMVSFRFTLY